MNFQRNRGKLVASVAALLALTTCVWAAVVLRHRIASWIHPVKPVRVEFCLAESTPGVDLAEKEFGGKKFYLHPAAVTNRDMATVKPTSDEYGKPALAFQMAKEGAEKLSQMTAQNIGKLFAMVIDGRVVCIANIRSRISRSGQLTGNFTRKEIDDLAKALNEP